MQKHIKNYAELKNGKTYFEYIDNSAETTIIFIHGLSVPSFIWDKNFSVIAGCGFNALRYDIYGRGDSAKPRLPNSIEYFKEQLMGLLNELNIKGRLMLCGISLGGYIASSFAAQNSNVEKVCLIDPLSQFSDFQSRVKMARLPFLSFFTFEILGKLLIPRRVPNDFYDFSRFSYIMDKFKEQIPKKNYLFSIRSSVAELDYSKIEEDFARLRDSNTECILIWGRHDSTISSDYATGLSSFLNGCPLHIIDEAAHVPNLEQADEVNGILKGFFCS